MFQQILANISFDMKYIWYIILFPIVLFWIWAVLYTTKDISHRTDNILYQLFAILLVFFWTPFIWFPLYFIIRPVRLKDEYIWRKSLETLSVECLDCWTLNNKENNFCVNCWTDLKIECKECKVKYYLWYDYCPYCWAPNLDLD